MLLDGYGHCFFSSSFLYQFHLIEFSQTPYKSLTHGDTNLECGFSDQTEGKGMANAIFKTQHSSTTETDG